MNSVVHVRDLSYRYGSTVALREVSLDLREGVTAVLGPNGAGKSTLLGLLSTAVRMQVGGIQLDDIDSRRDRKVFRRRLGFLPQTFTLPGNLTVAEFLTLTAWQRLVPRRERTPAVSHAMNATLLTDRRNVKISKLSGGMRRRVGIAQAIVSRPRLLLLDEPTVGLDPSQRRALRDLIQSISRDRAVVLSTHLTEDVAAMAERVVVLDHGEIRFDGPLARFGTNAAEIDAAYDSLTEGGLR